MAVDLRTVGTLAPPPGYSHVAVARGGTVAFTAGAIPLGHRGQLVEIEAIALVDRGRS